MGEYTAEEAAAYNKDLYNLELVWAQFKGEYFDKASDLHAPPALFTAAISILRGAGVSTSAETEASIANFMASMFEFGQLCAMQGLLAANMQPCVCTRIDDTDLEDVTKAWKRTYFKNGGEGAKDK